ncbi:tektin-2 [Cimex lectularius]|uniref:Tektin n=1 Tax=Cimex lectularius TaxID=79782 RepID=A0A8I6RGS8_CIMLE|nr:tektin-2 [Cimex lectularius]
MHSIVTLEKPTPRVPLPDWHGKVWELRQTCDTRRNDAFNLRNEARQLRNETDATTYWSTYHNDSRLAERILEITKWRNTMEDLIASINRELLSLKNEKALTEKEIEFLGLGFTVVNECLTQRDQRGGADLCTDEAELEIKKELRLLEAQKLMMSQKCMDCWEQVNRMEEVKSKIITDILEKEDTLTIDHSALGIDKSGANISYKSDPTRIPDDMVSYKCWLEHCFYLKMLADNELISSQNLRESMYVPRERSRNDLKAQNDSTNFSIRKRIFETQRIKNELDWQRLNMVKDMEKLHKEVVLLEDALANKANALKLAETRLERRLFRPSQECCRDDAAIGLENEVHTLKETNAALEAMLNQAKATFNALEDQLVIIDRELHNKNHALQTDLRCLDLRNRLVTGDRAPPNTQTDRNIILTRMQDEIPLETN